MTQDTPTPQDETGTPRAPLGFGRSTRPDPVDAAIDRHRTAYEKLERATTAVGIAETASRQAEEEAEAARKAASVADGAAWADLIATRPASMPGAVRLLRYVSTSPASEILDDPQDLLRKLTEAVEAAEAGEEPEGVGLAAREPAAAIQPDPALTAVSEFQAAWDALGEAIDAAGGAGVPEVDPDIEAREGKAYERLKTVRPTTPEGFRALAGIWAMILGGERLGAPSLAHVDHAADSLIAGAGACVPVVTDLPVSPALADLIARHRDLLRQSEADGLDDAAAEALDVQAWTLFRQACGFPAVGSADFAAKLELVAPEIAESLRRDDTNTAVHAWGCLCADLRRFGLSAGPEPVDWTEPPPGFMASPAVKPFGFVLVEDGLRIELERLHGIALAEFARLTGPETAVERAEQLRRALRLDALEKAVRGDGGFAVWPTPSGEAAGIRDGQADPRLRALVTAWEAAERAGNAPGLSDEERAPLIDHASSLLRDLYAFPARTMADICAKLPAFRDEAANTGDAPDAPDEAVTLEACALRGLVADLERLATGLTEISGDPDAELLRLIASVEAAQVKCDAAHTAWAEAEKAAAATRPGRPDDLRRSNDFQHFWGMAANPHSPEFYTSDEAAKFRHYEPAGHAHAKAEAAARARAAEIVAAFWRWQAEIRAHDEACGVAGLDRAHDKTCDDYQKALSAVMSARPATLAGVLAKARLSLSEDTAEFDRILRDDLLAMAGSIA